MRCGMFRFLVCFGVAAGVVAAPAAVRAVATLGTSPSTRSVARPDKRGQRPDGVVTSRFDHLPLVFVENRGQTDARVAYYVQGKDKSLYFTPEGITIALRGKEGRWAVRLEFVGADRVCPVGEDVSPTVISYFRGPRTQWKTGLRTFRRIAYRDLWPGIDLVCTGSLDRMKYEFRLAAGADPRRIRLAYRGASVALDAEGRLAVETPAGGFFDDRPVSWQEVDGRRVEVETAFAIREAPPGESRAYGFRLGEYDLDAPLVIDPAVRVYAGFIGGSGDDAASCIAVDASGNAYVAGTTESDEADFPVTVGPDLTDDAQEDAFVAKVNAAGTALLYCGYIGGAGIDSAGGIAVDASGNAFLAGTTSSDETSFPVATGPDLAYNGGGDAFVAKVNAAGTALLYCGYVGGAASDRAAGISLDSGCNAHIAGTSSSDEATFPVAAGPDLTYNGGGDAFVAKVNAAGTALLYCGYIGGAGIDSAGGIAVDASGNAFLAGTTDSDEATFPVSVGPDLAHNGSRDAFVAKVSAAGTALLFCGYIGGAGFDTAVGVAVDPAGNACIAGETGSDETTFPVSVGPDLTYNGNGDAFVAKVATAGTGMLFCGYLGGSATDRARAVAGDATGNVLVAGNTRSDQATFPVVVGPDLTYNGESSDSYLAEVHAAGTSLVTCGYIGGSDVFDSPDPSEAAYGVAVDGSGNAWVCGFTLSTESSFPDAVGPDLTANGGTDAFVARIGPAVTTPGLVKSFILPKRVFVKVVPDDDARSRLVSAGWIDLGPDPVDLTGPATVEVGDMAFAVEGFVPDASGTKFLHEEDGLVMFVAVSKAGSSRAKFKLKAWGAPAAQVDPEGEITLGFESDVAEGVGTVILEGGKYRL